MSVFNEAVKMVLAAEGGYANIPADRGGETYRGITRKNFPNWKGWTIIDQNKPLRHNQFIKNDELDKLVVDFYKANFWDPLNLDRINSNIATLTFDFAVGSGTITAARALQRIVNNITGANLTIDGRIGARTIAAINSAQPKAIYDALMQHRIDFFKRIAANDPSQQIFLKGWLNRLSKHKYKIAGAAILFALVLAGLILSKAQ